MTIVYSTEEFTVLKEEEEQETGKGAGKGANVEKEHITEHSR